MFKNKKKVLALTISLLVLFMSFMSTSYAAAAQSTITAQFKALKILLNGSQVTMESQPIIVNGSTYLPLRAFANLFNKNVDWNAELQQISITDKPDNEVATLKAQIVEKENQIIILQAQLAAKDDDDDEDEEDEEDIDDIISDLEDDLNDEYEDLGDDYFNDDNIKLDGISLDGDEDDIEIEIELDLEDFIDDGYDWSDLDEDDIIDLVQDICDDIWSIDELEDADIEGTIYDTYDDDELESFSVKAGRDVELD